MKIKFEKIRWTDEVFALGVCFWEMPFQIDINLGFFRIKFGG